MTGSLNCVIVVVSVSGTGEAFNLLLFDKFVLVYTYSGLCFVGLSLIGDLGKLGGTTILGMLQFF